MTAQEAIEVIDNLLLSRGYDSFRQDDDWEFQKVVEAFQDFSRDWDKSKTGELVDRINDLEDRLGL